MKISTWNINSVRVRLDQLIEFLQTNEIDVMLLQEIKCMTEIFPNEVFEDLGYNCAVLGQKSYNGVAILSKYLIEDLKFGNEVFLTDFGARYIEALVNGYKIVSVYVPNGQSVSLPAYKQKLIFMETLQQYLQSSILTDDYIIGGDFNVARSDIDVYDPEKWKNKVCCTDDERAAFEAILNVGFIDCCREFAGNKIIYTWWDYKRLNFETNKGLRLDYFLTTKNIEIKNYYIDLDVRSNLRPSDHAPIILELK
jgi:exodeoxyribonuclease-3